MPVDAPLRAMPLVAILRGIAPAHAADVARVLVDAGVRVIEVPMNSPEPFASIEEIVAAAGQGCLCGGGTVLNAGDVARVHAAGGSLVVAPNTDARVIDAALSRGMVAIPGFATATEAFTAIAAGATELKLFPASTYGAAHLKALTAVLPSHVHVHAVGGVNADNVADWVAAGASGFGFGSELFKPDYTIDDIGTRARRLVSAVKHAFAKQPAR